MKISLGFIFAVLALLCSIHYNLAASATVKKELTFEQPLAKEPLREELENADEEDIEPENKLLQAINEEDAAELENENDFNNDDDDDGINGDLLLNDDEENALQEAEDKNVMNDDIDGLDDDDGDINELAEVEEGRARRRRGRGNRNRHRRRGGRKNRRNRRARRNRKNRKGRRNRRNRRRRNRSG